MVDIEKDIVNKFYTLNLATHSDAFLDLSYEAQCLFTHLVLNSDNDGHVWRAKALSRMLFSRDFRVDTYQPLEELVETGFIAEYYDDLCDEGYEIIKQ